MKIGLIVPGFSADETDWCIPAHLNLARSLAATNQVHVFALRYPHRIGRYSIHGIHVHSFDGRSSHMLTSAQLWTTVLSELRREHLSSSFDVLHSIFGGEAGFITVLASRLLDVPSVVSLVGGELVALKDIGYGQDLRWRQRLLNQFSVRYAHRVLCGSRRMTEIARARTTSSDAARIHTLPLGVDAGMFRPSSLGSSRKGNFATGGRESRRELLNVGSLLPVKDQTTLLQAFAYLVEGLPNVSLSIIGAGELGPRLRSLSSEIHVSDRVQWGGVIPHEQLPQWYNGADLYVQSSRHEGEGMAVLEAAASGLPVVGTDVGILSDLAERGAAIVVPPKDPVALAEAMRQAMTSPLPRAARALEIAQSEYNLGRIRERLVRVYSSVSDSQHVPCPSGSL
jgi:glycosyltransferase involved in cell wall biosynthesis